MSHRKGKAVAPVFNPGQRIRLTKPILRYAMLTDAGYVEFDPPITWYEPGDTGYILRQSRYLPNTWVVYWGDEPPPAGIVEGFPVHANRLEVIHE